jgi:hypothetical protein
MVDGVTVSVANVISRFEAELIVGLLGSHGVDAVVSADDAGAQEPQLQLQGVRVLVARADPGRRPEHRRRGGPLSRRPTRADGRRHPSTVCARESTRSL